MSQKDQDKVLDWGSFIWFQSYGVTRFPLILKFWQQMTIGKAFMKKSGFLGHQFLPQIAIF